MVRRSVPMVEKKSMPSFSLGKKRLVMAPSIVATAGLRKNFSRSKPS
jgi:hypothetical protein